MAEFGIVLAAEEHGPRRLVEVAQQAETHGFERAWVSDHFHPWIDRQGESPFVWSVIGGVAATTERLVLGTGVTCPTIRIHPAIVAHAAATSAAMLEGRFFLGVGSGENLNEHVLGDRWPPATRRLEMLEEAIEVIRLLWQGGNQTHEGRHYLVENARLYTLPDQPPPVYVSAFGDLAMELAARVADGLIQTSPDGSAIRQYRGLGGEGPTLAGAKVCHGPDEDDARKLAFDLWPNMGVPGQLAQDLPTPTHFEQAVGTVDMDAAVGSIPCGPDPETHADFLRAYVEAGFDEIYVQQIGDDQEAFLRFYADEVLPLLL